jgi:hypothetical protein
MVGCLSGRKLDQDRARGAVENCKTGGRGSRNILCILRVVSERSTTLTVVNSLAWAPYDLGPILACASSDGKISVLSFQSKSHLSTANIRRRRDRRPDLPCTRDRCQRHLLGTLCSLHPTVEIDRTRRPAHRRTDQSKTIRLCRIRQPHPDLELG